MTIIAKIVTGSMGTAAALDPPIAASAATSVPTECRRDVRVVDVDPSIAAPIGLGSSFSAKSARTGAHRRDRSSS